MASDDPGALSRDDTAGTVTADWDARELGATSTCRSVASLHDNA